MQTVTYPAAPRPFNTVPTSDTTRPGPFQVPLNLSPDEIRELVRDILG